MQIAQCTWKMRFNPLLSFLYFWCSFCSPIATRDLFNSGKPVQWVLKTCLYKTSPIQFLGKLSFNKCQVHFEQSTILISASTSFIISIQLNSIFAKFLSKKQPKS